MGRYARALGVLAIAAAVSGCAAGTTTVTTTVTTTRQVAPQTNALSKVRRALRAEAALDRASIFHATPCAASEQGHVVEVLLYNMSCDTFIQAASGQGLFAGLWVHGLNGTDPTQETEICALVEGRAGIQVFDQRAGFIGTQICANLVHGGWVEVHQ